jgi:hypothetical protein
LNGLVIKAEGIQRFGNTGEWYEKLEGNRERWQTDPPIFLTDKEGS